MKIKLSSVFVDDQEKALKFYTEVLGFEKKNDIPLGDARWLTVVSPEAPDEAELVLEPNGNPISKTFQKALHDQGIPMTAFATDNIHKDYDRLLKHGVDFTMKPTKTGVDTGEVTIAVFDDTCGNLIQIYEV